MKILHVIFSFAPDGAETMLVDIINLQSKSNTVELIIINNIYNKELVLKIDKKVPVYYIDRKEGSMNIFKILKFNHRILKSRPDIIHFHNHNSIRLLLVKNHFKTCLTIHSVNKPTKYFLKYDRLFSISNAVKEDIFKRGAFASKVIYNGIDFSKIKPKEKTSVNNNYKIVVVSRLFHKVKGQDILLKAIAHLIYNADVKNINIDFIGEGPSLEYLQEMSEALNIKSYVRFLGFKDREYIYSNLRNYDLLVQPSIYEGFGLTVIEGMAAKIPVLASNTDGPSEIILNGEYGYLFESQTPVKCAIAIKDIIQDKTSERSLKIVDRAYEYAKSRFSIENTVQEYLLNYDDLRNN